MFLEFKVYILVHKTRVIFLPPVKVLFLRMKNYINKKGKYDSKNFILYISYELKDKIFYSHHHQ